MNNSRQHILKTLKALQTGNPTSPQTAFFDFPAPSVSFDEMLRAIGVIVHRVKAFADIKAILRSELINSGRWVTSLDELSDVAEVNSAHGSPVEFDDVGLFITQSPLAVAENGAVWLSEPVLTERVLPFIARHLAVVLKQEDIVNTMHDAYRKIGAQDYSFGCFVAGPSRTADIEQSLVLGAHGPMSMQVFILE